MISETFTVGDRPELDIRVHAGRVEIVPGTAGTISVTVETNDPNFRVTQRGDLIEIASDREARWLLARPAEVTVTMPPEGGQTQIRTATASVVVQCPMDRLDIDAASGEVRAGKVRRVEAKTASSNIRVEEVTETARLRTAAGDVRIERAQGTVDISTASGDIRIDDADAVVDVSTASGRVQVGRFVGSSINLKSMSGSFEVGMETGTKVDLDCTSLSGKVIWPPKVDPPPQVRRQVAIKAKSMSGDLILKRITT